MTNNLPSLPPEANPNELEIVSAEPIQIRAWSRDLVFIYKDVKYDVTQWYDEDNGNNFTWAGKELDLDELFDDPGFELDSLAADWLEDHVGG